MSRHGRNDVGAGLRIAQPDKVAGPYIHHIGRAGHRLASCRTDKGVAAGLPIAHTRRRLPVEPKHSRGASVVGTGRSDGGRGLRITHARNSGIAQCWSADRLPVRRPQWMKGGSGTHANVVPRVMPPLTKRYACLIYPQGTRGGELACCLDWAILGPAATPTS